MLIRGHNKLLSVGKSHNYGSCIWLLVNKEQCISVPCRLRSLDPALLSHQTGRVYVGLYQEKSNVFFSHIDPWSNVQGIRPPC